MNDTIGGQALSCSFCGKPAKEVSKLIAGPTVYICDECVGLCVEIIREEFPSDQEQVLSEVDAASQPETSEELVAAFDRRVIGQQAAKHALAGALLLHRSSLAQSPAGPVPPRILVAGPSGSGKNLLIKTMARVGGMCLAVADISRFSRDSLLGEEDVFQTLLKLAGSDETKAQQGMVCFDRLDRIVGQGIDSQRRLYALLSGTQVPVREKTLDTSKMTFACTGLFAELEGASLGNSELMKLGILPELAAAFDVRTRTTKPTAIELRRVLRLTGLLGLQQPGGHQRLPTVGDAETAELAGQAEQMGSSGWSLRAVIDDFVRRWILKNTSAPERSLDAQGSDQRK